MLSFRRLGSDEVVTLDVLEWCDRAVWPRLRSVTIAGRFNSNLVCTLKATIIRSGCRLHWNLGRCSFAGIDEDDAVEATESTTATVQVVCVVGTSESERRDDSATPSTPVTLRPETTTLRLWEGELTTDGVYVDAPTAIGSDATHRDNVIHPTTELRRTPLDSAGVLRRRRWKPLVARTDIWSGVNSALLLFVLAVTCWSARKIRNMSPFPRIFIPTRAEVGCDAERSVQGGADADVPQQDVDDIEHEVVVHVFPPPPAAEEQQHSEAPFEMAVVQHEGTSVQEGMGNSAAAT